MDFTYKNPEVGTINVNAQIQEIGYSNIKVLKVTALGEKGKLFTTLDLPVESTRDFIISKINQYIKEN